jgi:hypothetical protein
LGRGNIGTATQVAKAAASRDDETGRCQATNLALFFFFFSFREYTFQ